ncbi:MAG: type II toxin-antitoxin system RelE/ParE family toxin [Gemmatimonadetes bacterium]|nr:type II toxin-antitoxin system RelE/ParE family toxin [Gemmatimonadota bacterium]
MKETRSLAVHFYRTGSGREPVRTWLRSLDRESKKNIGADIKTVQFGLPIGMPVVRKLDSDLWEIRSILPGSNSRIQFTVFNGTVLLLHGFIKKSQKTPARDLALARSRLKMFREER